MQLTLQAYLEGIKNNTLDPKEVITHYIQKAKEHCEGKNLNAFVRIHDEYLEKYFENFDKEKITDTPLAWAPVALKDNIMLDGNISSCGSKMLKNYIAPYSAPCAKNLENNWACLLGNTNMDEFAMGSTTATSYFWKTFNPHGKNRLPWWSSGGSAAAIAGDLCLGALGSDTWGSVRQPAAWCGVVGLKPTYWRISRYGVQAMASSLDQIGIFSKTVEDCKILLENTMGFDSQDSQSNPKANEKIILSDKKLNEYKIALPKEFLGDGLDERIKNRILETVKKLQSLGVQVDIIDLPILEYGIAMYYIIQPAEASTNLARFDGIRFGLQDDTHKEEYKNIEDYITKIRSEGFGEEVKRRIMLWSFVLSSANYEWFYLKATKAREELKKELNTVFETYDFIISPTTPDLARKADENNDNPLKAYLSDLYTVPANMAGIPAISVPVWTVKDNEEELPVGLQIMGKHRDESQLLSFAKKIEELE